MKSKQVQALLNDPCLPVRINMKSDQSWKTRVVPLDSVSAAHCSGAPSYSL
jgi:hypothetical protein